jgi:hypothetical protein
MLIHAASGEFVTRASQTAIPDNRRALEYINAGGVIRGYANGGFVQPQYASNMPRWTSGGGGGGRPIEVVNNISPAQGMSEEQIGRIAAEKTAFALRGA